MDSQEANALEEQGLKRFLSVKITASEFYTRHIRKDISGRTAMRDSRKPNLGEQSPFGLTYKKPTNS